MTGVTAVIAHDAGGAEILSSYMRRLETGSRQEWVCALAGPAVDVFRRKLPQLQALPLGEVLRRSDRVLCGTGWQSVFELDAIAQARRQGKPSVAFLDHWVNYRQRFIRGDVTVLPDEIWVGDAMALKRAGAELPEVPLRLVENPYFLDVREQLAARADAPASTGGTSALFLCEPVREHALLQHGNERHWGYTEEEALAWFLDNVGALPQPVVRIVVRLHPSERPGKYDGLIARHGLPIEVSGNADLLDDILASNWVAGCNSMAMVTALLAQRRVLCCIPPGGRPCALPHAQIVHLQSLVDAQA